MGLTLQSPTGSGQQLPGAVVDDMLRPRPLAASVNDFAPPGHEIASSFDLIAQVGLAITGLAGGLDGRTVTLINRGPGTISLPAEDAASQAANRFAIAATLTPNQAVELRWIGANLQRWLMLGVGGGGGGGAPVDATYLTLSLHAGLTAERVLTAGTNVAFVDGGPNGALTINVPAAAPPGASYLTLGLDGALSAERVLTAGAGIAFVDGGANGTLTISATGGAGLTRGQAIPLAAAANLL